MMKKILFLLKSSLKLSFGIAMIAACFTMCLSAQNYRPDWAKDLIIYEIAPRGFTSPNGPESGTFKSAQEKLPYLKKLGINAIWLAGTNWANASHFYNIWTQYACIDPAKIDPVLGTPGEYKEFIDAAHAHGMRVFLDVITHGVMADSPIIKEHPDWFRGASWGMIDFDWQGNKSELDEWWVKTFTDYVTEYGVDGYRLDVDIHRPDLWNRIKKNAADAGHPIVVFTEFWTPSEGSADFVQRMVALNSQTRGADKNVMLHHDVAQFYDDFGYFRIVEACVSYTDGSSDYGYLDTKPYLDADFYNYIHPQGNLTLTLLNHPAQPSAEKQEPQRLRIEGVNSGKVIEQITLKPFAWMTHYNFGKHGTRRIGLTGSSTYEIELLPFVPDNLLYSVQLSSHDNGWTGFPLDKNPYSAQGSRALFGYSFLFTPAIPIFMSGEEFNADYIPLPTHTPGLFGDGEPGTGRWVYASMLDWTQLNQKAKQQMLEDVMHMIAIRKANVDLFAPVTIDKKPLIKAVSLQAEEDCLPVPYMLYGDKKAIVVCGNPTGKTVKGVLNVSLAGTPLENVKFVMLTDLWNGGKAKRVKVSDMEKIPVTMMPDLTARGGVAVFKIEVE